MSYLLDGTRILESATLFNGDSLGMYLADLGADVIKVESPFQGDYLRDFLGQVTPHNSPAHLQVNKNKRSVTLDLRNDEGKDLFWRLLATADVFIDGNAGDALDRLGVGYDDQRKRKPDIVYCQYSGYGAAGPYANIPTHGQMMNALAAAMPMAMGDDGFMHPTATPDPMNGTTTAGEGTAVGAVHAALHVAAALVRRQRTGEGCYIDVASSDAIVANGWIGSTYALNLHRVTDPRGLPARGGGESTGAKYQFYETADGKVMLFCCIEHKFWDNFCRAVGREELAEHKDTSAPVDFGGGEDELRRELQKIFHTRDLAEWMQLAAERDIPMGPAYRSVQEMTEDAHVRERGVVVDGEHPDAGPFTYVGEPAVVRGQPYRVRLPAPALGEHTREVLGAIGVDEAELDRLAEAKII